MLQEATVQVKEVPVTIVAYLRQKGPYTDIGNAIQKVLAWVLSNGWHLAGAPNAAYFNSPAEAPPEELHWEVRWPVGLSISPREPNEEGLGVRRVESRQVTAVIHRGPYNQVGSTYKVLMESISGQGYEICGPAEEVYLNDPASTAPEELLTEVRLPVKGGPC